MNFEKQFFESIASKLLEDGIDSYGDRYESPIKTCVNSWVEDNKVQIMQEVAKKVSVEELVTMITEKVKSSLTSSYWKEESFRDEIKKETIRQLACENTKVIMEKIKEEENK